jgi:hypothetical protein
MGVAASVLLLLGAHEGAALRSGTRLVREFMVFYTAGYVLNTSPQALYDPDSFTRSYHMLFPWLPQTVSPLYAHAPFEAVFYSPFAILPFGAALVAWQTFSLALIIAGFAIVWRLSNSLPVGQFPMGLLLALSFYPVSVTCLLRGHVSALAFFWIAVAIWCQRRGQDYRSGAALAMCLGKPTLLVLLVPMLAVGRHRRILTGLIAGAAALGVVSLAVVGWRGCASYVETLLSFAGRATVAKNPFVLSEYVDLNSFVRMLNAGHGAGALAVLALGAACILPCLAKLWAVGKDGSGLNLAWASTLTWTMVVNLYVAVYDTVIIPLGILLMGTGLFCARKGRVPFTMQILLVLLYVTPWIPPVPMGGKRTLQLYTLALIALGMYQLWLGMRRVRSARDVASG